MVSRVNEDKLRYGRIRGDHPRFLD